MGRMSLKTLVTTYLYNRTCVLEEEYNQKLQFVRYHKPDEVDYLELVIAKARKDLISEIIGDIMEILKINSTNYTK